MSAATLRRMARKKTPQPEAVTTGGTAPVRIAADLARMANIISTVTGQDVSEILSPILRPQVEKLYAGVVQQLSDEVKGSKE